MPEIAQARTPGGRPVPRAPARDRLSRAFDAVGDLPAPVEARDRVLKLVERGEQAGDGRLADAIEGDPALSAAVLRAANRNGNGKRANLGDIAGAIEALAPIGVAAAVGEVSTYDLLAPEPPWGERAERHRRHALAARHAAEALAPAIGHQMRDQLVVASLLHDLGRLVLAELYGGYAQLTAARMTPEERARRERRELGMDHALVGAVLVRRWGLPNAIGTAIERHHAPDADGVAAAIGLADMIAHAAAGMPVSLDRMRELGARVGLSQGELRSLLSEFPFARTGSARPRRPVPCPLSRRELDSLRGLAEGGVYKEIAARMGLSPSTVRTHLHNVYRKIGAADRAQAVLIARDNGWI